MRRAALPIDPFAPDDGSSAWRARRDRALSLLALALLLFFAPLGLAAGVVAALTAGYDLRHAGLGEPARTRARRARALAIGVAVVGGVCAAAQGVGAALSLVGSSGAG